MIRFFNTITARFPLAALVVAGVLVLATLLPVPWNATLDDAFVDLQFKLRGSRALSDPLLPVFIGDADVQALNGWPISRDYYSYLIYRLNQLGAKVVGLDLLFDQPERNYPEFDQALFDMVQAYPNICLPMAFAELQPAPANNSGDLANLPIGYQPLFPLRPLRRSVAGLGFSNFDQAAVMRQVPIAVAVVDSFMSSFGCELARLYFRASVRIEKKALILTEPTGTEHRFAMDQGRLRLNHFGDLAAVKAIGFLELLQALDENPNGLDVRDKIMVLAVTAASVVKVQATPLASTLPATLIHATVAENLITGNYLRQVNLVLAGLLVLVLAALAWACGQIKAKPWQIIAAIVLLSGYWLVAQVFFSKLNRVLPLFYPTVGFILTLALTRLRQIRIDRRQDQALQQLLADQIQTREAQLEEARQKLQQAQQQLQQETYRTEQSQALVAEKGQLILDLEKELRDLQAYIRPKSARPSARFPEIIYTEGSKMAQVLDLVTTVSTDEIPVLIMGETGTGKEMIAQAIHRASKRKNAPFVAINCGALSETLLESELFGHEKGSFTGAHSRRKGRFELANNGTVFLDEITETTPAFQTRLLRVLQEGCFERLGGEQTIKVNIRIIAATNKNVHQEMTSQRFRADLFYRLNGFPITIAPLRERSGDIPLLVEHFIKKHGYTTLTGCSDRAMELMQAYHWPGNVRELENCVRRAAILATSASRKIIREGDLPEEILRNKPEVSGYRPLEDQILELLRSFGFSRAAISQTAQALGNRDRGTVTEYFRGICFEHLVQADFDTEKAARAIANSTDAAIIARVKAKINEYLQNLPAGTEPLPSNGDEKTELPVAFKGLAKKYHVYLLEILRRRS